MMRSIYGPALYDDSRPAYLFQCGDTDLFAVSLDETGANIPTDNCWEGWHLRSEFPLGVHEAVPVPIDPEPILRGIRAHGYYVWREGNTSKPHGTSQ
jgi:hypothetical protein